MKNASRRNKTILIRRIKFYLKIFKICFDYVYSTYKNIECWQLYIRFKCIKYVYQNFLIFTLLINFYRWFLNNWIFKHIFYPFIMLKSTFSLVKVSKINPEYMNILKCVLFITRLKKIQNGGIRNTLCFLEFLFTFFTLLLWDKKEKKKD